MNQADQKKYHTKNKKEIRKMKHDERMIAYNALSDVDKKAQIVKNKKKYQERKK